MSIETVRDILVADPAVLALVEARISPYVRAQDEALPAVVIEISSVTPFSNLASPPSLDLVTATVTAWAATYDEAVELSAACRSALEAAGLSLNSQSERFEPSVEEYLVAMDFTLFV